MTLTSDLLDCPGNGLVIGANGIRVEPPAAGTLLKANVTTGNGGDGIDIESPATTTGNANRGQRQRRPRHRGRLRRHRRRRQPRRGNGNPAGCVGCEVFLTAINQRPSPGLERAVVGFRGG